MRGARERSPDTSSIINTAEVLAFCASDRPGYLTGVDVLCDGGTRAGLDLKGTLVMARGN